MITEKQLNTSNYKRKLTFTKKKICAVCDKEFIPNSGSQKYCSDECRRKAIREWHKQWRLNNYEKWAESQKRYRQSEKGKQKLKEILKRYRKTEKYKKKHREESRRYRQRHKDKIKQYWLSPRGREIYRKKMKKIEAKRKGLGFIPLNEYKDGYEAHHIDKEHVIFIPPHVHKLIPHNVWTGKGMKEINKLAIQYCDVRDY